ncbi:PREDICTED: uncharacterized protein LOC109471815 [Branchiostoma belcheri]|uniref:Uncharacterized protein LOC109471815 n=1 Tax=Branchiostoma belcheri TaxID=7741 RepID=A0A6P4YYE7_BRABE|nr:PREDICTED: uncharacterized protein LOC109471815 [Branchiostoma belcheri]
MASDFTDLGPIGNRPAPPTRSDEGKQQQRETLRIKAPDGLEVVETDNRSVKLRWNQLSSNTDQHPAGYELVGYRLEQRIPFGSPQLSEWISAHGQNEVIEPTTEFRVVDLTPYQRYQICVRSALLNSEGDDVLSERSVRVHVLTRKQYQPYRPRSVRLDDTHGSRKLTWTEPKPAEDVSPESYQYVVESSLHVADNIENAWMECSVTTQHEWIVSVEQSGDYRFRVSTNNTEKNVHSLPQEMEHPRIYIRIETPAQVRLEFRFTEVQWRFPGQYEGQYPGSIIFVISCHDLSSLRELWMNYRLGKVKKFIQYLLARHNELDTELEVKIEEKDFYASRRHLLLTRPTDRGFRVARLGDAPPRGTGLGLSEDFPVYCRPTSHRTTCSQLDFLDPAVPNKQLHGLDQTTAVDDLMALSLSGAEVSCLSWTSYDDLYSASNSGASNSGSFDSGSLDLGSKSSIPLMEHDNEAREMLIHKQEEEIQRLQEINKTMADQIQALTAENTKMSNQLADVPDLREELRGWREKAEESQKVLSEQEREIQQLQETKKSMATRIEELLHRLTSLQPDDSEEAGLKDIADNLAVAAMELRESDEASQKVLSEARLQIQQVQETFKNVAGTVEKLTPQASSLPELKVLGQKLQRVTFGREGSGPGQFKNPWGVAVSEKGEIFLADKENQRIQVFTLQGTFVRQFPTVVSGEQKMDPHDVALDGEGNLWVVGATDSADFAVQYDKQGRMLGKFDLQKTGWGRGVAVDTRRNHILITQTTGDWDNQHGEGLVFRPDGTLVGTVGQQQGMKYPWYITVDGNILVSDRQNHCVYVYNEDGQFLFQFGGEGSGEGQLCRPRGICTDRAGNIIVADTGNSRVEMFDKTGKFLKHIATDMWALWAVAMATQGQLVVTDYVEHKVSIFQDF